MVKGKKTYLEDRARWLVQQPKRCGLSEVSDRKYVYSGTNKVAYIKQDTTHFYLADHLGSTRVVLRSDGVIPARTDYWPYGETLEQTAVATRWLYTGHERDGESASPKGAVSKPPRRRRRRVCSEPRSPTGGWGFPVWGHASWRLTEGGGEA